MPEICFFEAHNLPLTYHLSEGDEAAPAAVFLATWGHGLAMGQAAAKAFVPKNMRILTIDTPGIGHNADRSAFVHIRRIAQAVAALLRHLNLRESLIIGHGFGSMIAQEIALSEDDVVGKLILISPLSGVGGLTPSLASSMELFNRLMLGHEGIFSSLYSEGQIGLLKPSTGKGNTFNTLNTPLNPTTLSGQIWAATRWTNLGRTHNLYQPTLILQGTTDPLSPAANARVLATALPAATLQCLTGSHFPFFEHAADCAKLTATNISNN